MAMVADGDILSIDGGFDQSSPYGYSIEEKFVVRQSINIRGRFPLETKLPRPIIYFHWIMEYDYEQNHILDHVFEFHKSVNITGLHFFMPKNMDYVWFHLYPTKMFVFLTDCWIEDSYIQISTSYLSPLDHFLALQGKNSEFTLLHRFKISTYSNVNINITGPAEEI